MSVPTSCNGKSGVLPEAVSLFILIRAFHFNFQPFETNILLNGKRPRTIRLIIGSDLNFRSSQNLSSKKNWRRLDVKLWIQIKSMLVSGYSFEKKIA